LKVKNEPFFKHNYQHYYSPVAPQLVTGADYLEKQKAPASCDLAGLSVLLFLQPFLRDVSI
jgi:hypothetical protein